MAADNRGLIVRASSEIRRDPAGGGWVIIAAERAKRPYEFRPIPVDDPAGAVLAAESCPFCPNREGRTPPEVAAVRPAESRPDGPGWSVRVVPNKYPVLTRGAAPRPLVHGFFEASDGIGVHEVVIETPDHQIDFSSLVPAQALAVVRTWRERIRSIEAEPQYVYIQLFKNQGRAAGASLSHPHSQIAALPFIPPRIRDEIEASARFQAATGECLHCRMIEEETAAAERMILRNEAFIVTAPFASRFPYEMHVHPLRHAIRFTAMDEGETALLAAALQDVLGRLRRTLNDPPFNLILHQAPAFAAVGEAEPSAFSAYHWHFEILVMPTREAGFEWGTGVHINPVPPEEAAAVLRG
jgi:UDPglucose--hexose-1-phosphate uridylyltransferase